MPLIPLKKHHRILFFIIDTLLAISFATLLIIVLYSYMSRINNYSKAFCHEEERYYPLRQPDYPSYHDACILVDSSKIKNSFDVEESHCKYFRIENNRNNHLPTQTEAKVVIITGFIIIMSILIGRFVAQIYIYICKKDPTPKNYAYIDYWIINLLFTCLFLGFLGLIPVLKYIYTDICIEAKHRDSADDSTYQFNPVAFWIILGMLVAFNILWIIPLHRKTGCGNCCRRVPLFFYPWGTYILWIIMFIVIFSVFIENDPVVLTMGIIYLVWGILCGVYLIIEIFHYPYVFYGYSRARDNRHSEVNISEIQPVPIGIPVEAGNVRYQGEYPVYYQNMGANYPQGTYPEGEPPIYSVQGGNYAQPPTYEGQGNNTQITQPPSPYIRQPGYNPQVSETHKA